MPPGLSHAAYAPIAVLDSGLGGLTVVRALRKKAPAEDILYFGDTARLPYGSKSPETISRFVGQILTYLQQYRPKHIILACNTASALAMETVKREFSHLSISGVIEPGARAAIKAAGNSLSPMIGVIATEATVKSKAYERAIFQRRHYVRLNIRATPLLAPIIEEGRDEKDLLVRLALTQYLKPVADLKPDVLVLGCTHYPVFKRLISRMMGSTCRVIDSAEQCAMDVTERLGTSGLLSPAVEPGTLRCFVTDGPEKFASLASRFLGSEIETPTHVCVEQLTDQPKLKLAMRAAV
jgi:glutamate racemase